VPTFTNSLPKVSKHHGYDLRRTPLGKPLTAIVTCESLLCCDTHYWHGRTLPCERITNEEGKTIDDSTCLACQQKQPYRTHVYVSVFDGKTHEHFLFECTAFAAKPLEEYFQTVGTLRGCGFSASRPKGTPNGKVVIATATANISRCPLPAAPDIALALCVIWRIPRIGLSFQLEHSGTTEIKANSRILDQMRNQPDNVGDPASMAEILGSNGNGRKKR